MKTMSATTKEGTDIAKFPAQVPSSGMTLLTQLLKAIQSWSRFSLTKVSTWPGR